MYYLIQSNQNPTIAIKRYHEYLELTASGANGADLSKHIKEHKLFPGGLPWKTILFSIENGKFKEHQKGSYYELAAYASANCTKLFAYIDCGDYKEAMNHISYTQERLLGDNDPARIGKLFDKLGKILSFDPIRIGKLFDELGKIVSFDFPSLHPLVESHQSESSMNLFYSVDWSERKKKLLEVREEFKKLTDVRLILDPEMGKMIENNSTRVQVVDAIEYARSLYDSIVHELDLVEAWCDTALSGLPGLKTPQNFYVAKSHVED